MESLIQKLKNSATLTLILGILSLTWLVIDYFVLGTLTTKVLGKFELEWILLIFSAAAIIVFHISVFITIYYSYRVVRKIRKELKTKTNPTAGHIKEIQTTEPDRSNA